MNKKFIVTIGRQYGSGGREIGKRLAEKLGVDFYDKELITLAAKKHGMSEKVFESAQYLINARKASTAFDFEFRTTIVKEFHTEDDFIIIGSELCGAPRYFLQKFEDRGNCIASSLHTVPKEDAEGFAAVLRDYIPEVGLRGYDDD